VGWIVVAAWGFAVVVAAVVLGFGADELRWKRARLARDLAVLRADVERLDELSAALRAASPPPATPGI
jgi:hypothetical protein